MTRITLLAASSVLSVLAIACGKPFTSAPGGSGGGGAGAGGTTGNSATTSTSGAGGCDPNDYFACGNGEYCKTDDCVSGKCTKLPGAVGTKWEPVCGCNGIAYWNHDVALLGGAGYREGACDVDHPPPGLVKCFAGNAGVCQTQGAGCYVHSLNDCLDTPGGVCVVVPANCSGIDTSNTPAAASCGQAPDDCQDLCHLIAGARRWHPSTSGECTPP
jgi:hypothetical protein